MRLQLLRPQCPRGSLHQERQRGTPPQLAQTPPLAAPSSHCTDRAPLLPSCPPGASSQPGRAGGGERCPIAADQRPRELKIQFARPSSSSPWRPRGAYWRKAGRRTRVPISSLQVWPGDPSLPPQCPLQPGGVEWLLQPRLPPVTSMGPSTTFPSWSFSQT